jgi:hypothetical protein
MRVHLRMQMPILELRRDDHGGFPGSVISDVGRWKVDSKLPQDSVPWLGGRVRTKLHEYGVSWLHSVYVQSCFFTSIVSYNRPFRSNHFLDALTAGTSSSSLRISGNGPTGVIENWLIW